MSIICEGDAGLADSVPVGCEAFWVKPTKLYKVAAFFERVFRSQKKQLTTAKSYLLSVSEAFVVKKNLLGRGLNLGLQGGNFGL